MKLRFGVIALALSVVASAFAASSDVAIEANVRFGGGDDAPLVLDVLKPKQPNGAGIVYLQSGAWSSFRFDPHAVAPVWNVYLSRGYAVFIVHHRSALETTIPEVVDDVRRSIRFLRSQSGRFGVDPDRLGALGLSSGGHLALMLGTTGDDGDPAAADVVLRSSSRVAAVVALAPPTDLRAWVADPPVSIKQIPGIVNRLKFDPARAAELSPVTRVTARTAPTLLLHGDRDDIVSIQHSQIMIAALRKTHVPSELIVVPGGGHDFSFTAEMVSKMVDWFDRHLKAIPAPPARPLLDPPPNASLERAAPRATATH